MKNVICYLKELADSGEDLANEDLIFNLIWYLVEYFKVEPFVKMVKDQFISYWPDTKMGYDCKNAQIDYYMETILKEKELLRKKEFSSPRNMHLYCSITILKSIRHEIEHILDLHVKSKNKDTFEGIFLAISLIVQRLEMEPNLTEQQRQVLSNAQRFYAQNKSICPFERIADYYAYEEIINLLHDEEEVLQHFREDYKASMDYAYQITSQPTEDYLSQMMNLGLIKESEFDYILNCPDVDKYKYGLYIPK